MDGLTFTSWASLLRSSRWGASASRASVFSVGWSNCWGPPISPLKSPQAPVVCRGENPT